MTKKIRTWEELEEIESNESFLINTKGKLTNSF